MSAELSVVDGTPASLDLPEPQDITLGQVKAFVIPRAHAIREYIRETGDIGAARELGRRLEAFRRYVADKEARNLIAAECRRTEVLIGHLLGPGSGTQGQRTDLSPASERSVAIPREDRHKFRLLAEHEPLVEEMLSDNKVSRKALLEGIQFRPGAPVALGPDQCTTLVADPPWRYGNTATRASAQGHYDTLSIAQLCGEEPLPDGGNIVQDVVLPKSASPGHLYLWTTAGHLPDAFSVMAAWGYTYKTYLIWAKPQMGMGNYFRVSTEIVLFGVRGDMRTRDMGIKNWFEAKRGQHSAKPLEFYDIVSKASPGPYLEMFARCGVAAGSQLPGTCQCSRCRLGWEVWGNQA
jgi:N6-adenosine-specific RNA methylase IME4